MNDGNDERQSGEEQADADDHVEHDRRRAFGMQEEKVAYDENEGHQNDGNEHRPLNKRQNAQNGRFEFGSHFSAVVAGYKDHLPAAGSTRLGGIPRFVLRHNVLAYPAGEKPRYDRTARRFKRVQNRRDCCEDHCGDGKNR